MKLVKDKLLLKFVIGLLVLANFFLEVWLIKSKNPDVLLSPLGEISGLPQVKPLEKYSFENLKKRGGIASKITLEKVLTKNPKFTGWQFSYISDGRKISGLANIPVASGSGMPVVVMLRGFVEKEQYQTGVGTRPAGEVYAANGYITLAPDYLGYGESDMPPGKNVWEERFLRHVANQDLLVSVGSLPQADTTKIFLWGHSNGGMEVLTALELSGGKYPAVLWAPVSEFFPYDVLYYTYEFEDQGKALRKELADFEKDYDVSNYSNDSHFDWIKTPAVQLHQGTADAYIPLSWSDNLAKKVEKEGVNVSYFTYPGMDHNMRPAWDTVVSRDLVFFRKYL